MNYDPVEDENKQFTFEEWAELAKAEIDTYVKVCRDQNDFYKKPNTWREWMNSFINYMSW